MTPEMVSPEIDGAGAPMRRLCRFHRSEVAGPRKGDDGTTREEGPKDDAEPNWATLGTLPGQSDTCRLCSRGSLPETYDSMRCRGRFICRPLFVLISILALVGASTDAATVTVDTAVDELDATPNASCSVREAVESANSDADFGGCVGVGPYGDDTILLPAGTYGLSRTGSAGSAPRSSPAPSLATTRASSSLSRCGSGVAVRRRARRAGPDPQRGRRGASAERRPRASVAGKAS
jgi:CSLREA domain-containing protein